MQATTTTKVDICFYCYFITACKKSFAMYDRDAEGKISTRELGSVMRCMGYNPTANELTDMVNEVDAEGKVEIVQMTCIRGTSY